MDSTFGSILLPHVSLAMKMELEDSIKFIEEYLKESKPRKQKLMGQDKTSRRILGSYKVLETQIRLKIKCLNFIRIGTTLQLTRLLSGAKNGTQDKPTIDG